jgi:hypothetical protein
MFVPKILIDANFIKRMLSRRILRRAMVSTCVFVFCVYSVLRIFFRVDSLINIIFHMFSKDASIYAYAPSGSRIRWNNHNGICPDEHCHPERAVEPDLRQEDACPTTGVPGRKKTGSCPSGYSYLPAACARRWEIEGAGCFGSVF